MDECSRSLYFMHGSQFKIETCHLSTPFMMIIIIIIISGGTGATVDALPPPKSL